LSLSDLESRLHRFGYDRYLGALLLTILLAALLPAQGAFAEVLSQVTFWAVALLYFLYGAKLSLAAIWAGLTNWRLQIGVLAATYLLFPVLTLGVAAVAATAVPAAVAAGFIYIGCLPSTVQSSIAFTSIARGNVAGAVCAASVSNLLGVVLAPLLLALLLASGSGEGLDLQSAVWKIAQQILIPFLAGQLVRPWLAGRLNRHKLPLMIVDRGSILLIVYSAFSAGMVQGIWSRLAPSGIAVLVILCLGLLAVALVAVHFGARLLGLGREDRVAALCCGSTKSLATGLPMAKILFPHDDLALIVLPLMLYHMIQLAVLAVWSRRAAAQDAAIQV
jgi:sodium/bile acid cotransporter 7